MGSKTHRIATGLAGGCAILLGLALAGCGAPQYTYVANSGQGQYFKVPYGWHKISDSSLSAELKTITGSSGTDWRAAYEAGSKPTASDFLSFDTSQPFVYAETGPLSPTETSSLSYDSLRDFYLPVTSSARTTASADHTPLTAFKQIRDQVLTPSQGVHGVREIFDYTDAGVADTFDEIALTNADQTEIYLLVLHCTTSCYSSDQTEINDVMSSFTVRSPS